MKKFNKTNKFEGRDSGRSEKRDFRRSNDSEKRDFRRDSPEKRFGGRDSKDSGFQLFQATCDKCGRECDIPFKPTGNKPVYCRSCFRENSSSESRSNNFDRGRSEPRFESKNMTSSEDLDKINRKLDKIMKALKIE